MPDDCPPMNLGCLSDGRLADLRGLVEAEMRARGAPADKDAEGCGHSTACRMFTVSEGVRHLDARQLDILAESFLAWAGQGRDERTRRSRERVLLAFLVLRYTGARLGEVLALDESRDIDFKRGVAAFSGNGNPDQAREVPLPGDVVRRLREWCESNNPEASDGRKLFDLDQGFLRRKFHEQEKSSGLPRELLNPRVLRNSRAVELLRGGMPMRAVQALLGHTRTDFTASYVTMAGEDLKTVIHSYCSREFDQETSARNTFTGRITRIESSSVAAEVVLRTDSGHEVSAILTRQSSDRLGLAPGRTATALVKATWVALEHPMEENPAAKPNAFPGRVVCVDRDQAMAEILGKLADGTPVCALLTRQRFDRLDMAPGSTFIFTFNPMSVIITQPV